MMIALEREATATLAEFMHGLQLAFPGQIGQPGQPLQIGDATAGMRITLTPLPPRIIAALQLPRLRVTMVFTHGTEQQQAELLAKMDRALQRGGG